MTTKDKKDVAGKALYCEFRKDGYTYQLVLTPPAVGLDNNPVKMSTIRRKVSVWHPRRNWNVDASRTLPTDRDAYGEFVKLDAYSSKDVALNIWKGLYGSQLTNLLNQGWSLFKKPLVAEFTYEELETIQNGKMPVSLYRRFERVRKNQGFPETLFDEVAVAV